MKGIIDNGSHNPNLVRPGHAEFVEQPMFSGRPRDI